MSATASDPPIETETRATEGLSESTDSGVRDHESVSRDDLFDVLSNHRRRYALHHLKQRDGAVAVGDLAEEIAAWENGVSQAELSAADRKRVYTALQQFHLPKMDTTGIVEFDSSGTVTLTEAADGLDVYFDIVAEDDIPWSRFYLGLSGMCLVVVAGVWLAPFTLVSGAALAAFIVTVFLLSSLAHAYHSRGMRLGSDGTPPDLPER